MALISDGSTVYVKNTEVATVKGGGGQETTLSLLIMKKRLKRKGK